MLIHHLLVHVSYVLASRTLPLSVVPDPDPVSPIDSSGVTTLFSYAKWGAFAASGASALVAAGALGFAHHNNNPGISDKAKRALLWSLGGAAVTGLAIPTLNTIIGSVH
jgi:hypothetical protein